MPFMRRRLCVLNYYVRTCPYALNYYILKHLCNLIFHVPIYISHAFVPLCLQLFCVYVRSFFTYLLWLLWYDLGMQLLEEVVCFEVLNGIKDQIVQWEIAILGIEVSLNTFCKARNNLMHEGTKSRKYISTCTHIAR